MAFVFVDFKKKNNSRRIPQGSKKSWKIDLTNI